MSIETLLAPRKKAIVDKWIDQTLDSYGSPDFFKKQKDRFANPIGTTIAEGLQNLFDILISERELGEAAKSLENIIKIRAVQDFTPSKAVFFVYLLKNILRGDLVGEMDRDEVLNIFSKIDVRIDEMALMAFNFYMNCREQLHLIRVNELLSGRSAFTDGTQCFSAMLKKNQIESAKNN